MPTTIFAPEEIPSTKGPAMGLRKKVWSKKPDTDSAPPRMAASSIRGIRILKIILLSEEASVTARRVSEPVKRSRNRAFTPDQTMWNTSPAGISTEPVFTLSTSPHPKRRASRSMVTRKRPAVVRRSRRDDRIRSWVSIGFRLSKDGPGRRKSSARGKKTNHCQIRTAESGGRWSPRDHRW